MKDKSNKKETGKFRDQLQRSVLRRIIILLAVGGVMFILGQLLITYTVNEGNARNNLDKLETVFLNLYNRNHDFLEKEEVSLHGIGIIEGNEDITWMEQTFYRYNSEGNVENEMILSDVSGEIKYSSFSDKDLTSYLVNYNDAICFKVKKSGEKDIYHAVYFDTGNYSDYMFVKPLYHGEELLGYLTLFLSGDDWNFYLSNKNFDGVITEERNNVIYCSKGKLTNPVNKFYPASGRLGYYNEERYWTISKTLADYNVTIHSLVYYPKNTGFFIGLLIIAVMSLFWYKIANWMAAAMADNNADRIGKLVKEIRIIRKKDHRHRIEMGTEDEFEEVAYQINYMLDNIQALNDKNTELLQLNNAMEMGQLTAQINPHFLYNTLEIIRNLVSMDARRADELIVLLTQLLRYSINHQVMDVLFADDMQYIQMYLDIQKCRFGDRFAYTMDIEEACERCMVPKLLLQPLIENSIKYSFKKQMNIHLDIKGWMEGKRLMLSVTDDGPGMDRKSLEALNARLTKANNDTGSFGLHNISRRLYLQYGEESGIKVRMGKEKGLEVIVSIMQSEWEV